MKYAILTLVLALALVGGANAGGPHLRELVERVGLLEAADAEHEAALAELELEVDRLGFELRRLDSRTHAQLKCMSRRVRALELRRRPVTLCSSRGALGPR